MNSGLDNPFVSPDSKAATIVVRDLCRRIVEGEYREGDILPSEAELIASYGVSRAVLREAIRLLEWDSFVRVRRGAGGGAIVMLPDARVPARYCGLVLQILGTTLEDVDQAIAALEPQIVATLAGASHAHLELLEEALDAEIDGEGSASDFLTSGSHFHDLLPSALGNPALKVLLDIPRQIRLRHSLTALRSLTEDPVYHRRTLSAHRKALDLIRDGDAIAARDLWARHLAATSRALGTDGPTTVLDLFNGWALDFDLTAQAVGGRAQPRMPKSADIVASDLRRQIITGTIPEGAPVPTEGALMERYGLSRPSVREALRVLEAEHLVRLVRGAHQGGRAQRPKIATAIWQTGLLMQRVGCIVSDVAGALAIVDHCASRLLSGTRSPSTGTAEVFDSVLEADRSEPSQAGGELAATLDMFDAVGRHVPNRTMEALGTIGRALLRRAVDTTGRGQVRLRPAKHNLSPESEQHRARGASQLARIQLTLINAAKSRSLDQLTAAWADGSRQVYSGIAGSPIAEHRIDMFR